MNHPALHQIRNIGIISHVDAGKTTVSERILYYAGEIHRMGEVHDGASTMDWMEQEQERGITITATSTTCRWGEVWINLIDTPGHIDFTIEVERSLRVLDGAVVIFSAVEGVQPQSESVWRQANRYRVPRICLINKLDRIGADYPAVLEQMRTRLTARPVLMQLPDGQETTFHGVVDLLEQRFLTFSESDQGATVELQAIPAELRAETAEARGRLIEAAADFDDSVLEDYLEGREIVVERLRAAIRKGTLLGELCPVFLGAALRNKGIQPLLDGVCYYLPSPLDLPPVAAESLQDHTPLAIACAVDAPLCALAFKVVADEGRKLAYVRVYSGELRVGDQLYNATRQVKERATRLFRMHARQREAIDSAQAGEIVAIAGLREVLTGDSLCAPGQSLLLQGLTVPETVVSLAIEPQGVEDREKLLPALEKLQWEDPTFRVHEDPETGQTLLTGMGELHLEVMIERLRREYGVVVRAGRPQVVCRETIQQVAERREIFQRDADGRVQSGEVLLRLSPLARGAGLHQKLPPIEETQLPVELQQILAESLEHACTAGALAGYPLIDLEARIVEAPFVPGVTTEIGLRLAVQRGFAQALRDAVPLLLEPIMALELTVPAEYAGRVHGCLQQRHGRVEGVTVHDGIEIVRASAPLAELFGFMTELRSATKGHGSYSMEFSHFDAPSAKLSGNFS